MLLRPKNKAEFVSQIITLRPEQRKVVVLAGRHLNEGSRNLAVRHHAEWEKHGAVTVLIPAAWTPHGFWREIEKLAIKKGKPARRMHWAIQDRVLKIPKDEDLMHLVAKHVKCAFVNLHGTAEESKPGLEVIVHHKAPRWLQMAVHKTIQNAPPHINADWQDRDNNDGPKHPLEVLVEHNFTGKPLLRPKSTGRKRAVHPQLGGNYLTESHITRGELAHFKRELAPTLDKLIQNLGEHVEKTK